MKTRTQFQTITVAVAISGAEVVGKSGSNYDIVEELQESLFMVLIFQKAVRSSQERSGWEVYKSIWSEW